MHSREKDKLSETSSVTYDDNSLTTPDQPGTGGYDTEAATAPVPRSEQEILLDELRDRVQKVLGDQQQLDKLVDLKGGDAQCWLDALQTLAAEPDGATGLHTSLLLAMFRLSESSGLYPRSFVVENVKRLGDCEIGGGMFGDVWKGRIGKQTVALKIVRQYENSNIQERLKHTTSEAIVWRQLNHPNIIPFLGMCYLDDTDDKLPYLISPWMEQGSLAHYLKNTPRKHVDCFSLVHDIASGLLYLHNNKIVHGDLKSGNILITPDTRACIGGFAMSGVVDSPTKALGAAARVACVNDSGHRMGAELRRPNATRTPPNDMYAFSYLFYEIFSGNVNLKTIEMWFGFAPRPDDPPVDDKTWKMVLKCWSRDPNLRPTAFEVFEHLASHPANASSGINRPPPNWDVFDLGQVQDNVKHPLLSTAALIQLQRRLDSFFALQEEFWLLDPNILDLGRKDNVIYLLQKLLDHEQGLKKLMEVGDDKAQVCLDALQILSEHPDVKIDLRPSIIKMMVRLSQRSGLWPRCLTIDNVKKLGNYEVDRGGFADVWKGEIGDHTGTVCLKIMRKFEGPEAVKEFTREAIVWQQLNHPNLLPFMGMFSFLDGSQKQLCLISPWMEHGNLFNFLRDNPIESIDHYSLVHDVASGLLYLHNKDIVHCDLKGGNILITPDGRACIADFGLSRVRSLISTPGLTTTTSAGKYSPKYSSPEILFGGNHTKFSDIYAFGCVCYEIFARSVPWGDMNDGKLILTVCVEKKTLERPESTALNEEMWTIMSECWKTDPHTRPSASDVFARVDSFPSLKTGDRVKPALDWSNDEFARIRKNVKHSRRDMRILTKFHSNLSLLFDEA